MVSIPHKRDDVYLYAKPFSQAIAARQVADHSAWSKLGYAAAVSAEQTITPQGGNYVFPTAGMQMSFRSTDVAGKDVNPGGSGVRTLTLYYLDSNYIERTEVLALNGNNWVDTAAVNIFRIQNLRVTTTGADYVPAGNISLVDKATRAITYGYIRLGFTRQRQLIWTVPAGKVLYIAQITRSCTPTTSNKYVLFTLRATYDEKADTVLTPGLMWMPFAEAVVPASSTVIDLCTPLRFPAQTDLKYNASSDGTSAVEALCRGWTVTIS